MLRGHTGHVLWHARAVLHSPRQSIAGDCWDAGSAHHSGDFRTQSHHFISRAGCAVHGQRGQHCWCMGCTHWPASERVCRHSAAVTSLEVVGAAALPWVARLRFSDSRFQRRTQVPSLLLTGSEDGTVRLWAACSQRWWQHPRRTTVGSRWTRTVHRVQDRVQLALYGALDKAAPTLHFWAIRIAYSVDVHLARCSVHGAYGGPRKWQCHSVRHGGRGH